MSEITSSFDAYDEQAVDSPSQLFPVIEHYQTFFDTLSEFVSQVSESKWTKAVLQVTNVTAQTAALIGTPLALGELSRNLGDSEETIWLLRGLMGTCVAALLFFINVETLPLEWIEENPTLKKIQSLIDDLTYTPPEN
ncbi:MAG TPA: hypothetical protein VF209_04830 [Patescibacteria group bacterium]